jgi:hypothetical protein
MAQVRDSKAPRAGHEYRLRPRPRTHLGRPDRRLSFVWLSALRGSAFPARGGRKGRRPQAGNPAAVRVLTIIT